LVLDTSEMSIRQWHGRHELKSKVVYGLKSEGGRKVVEVLLENLIVEVKNI